VKFVLGHGARRLHVDGGHIVGAELTDAQGASVQLHADWFVAAMPVEKARILFDAPVRAAAPELARLDKLEFDYMNGIQFFLKRPPAHPVKGHVAYLDSPWALTSIDQSLFWKRDLQRQYGDGRVTDILSVDISDFFTPGILYGKPAVECTATEIARECWAQMKQALNTSDDQELTDDMIVSWFLDPAVSFRAHGAAMSTEPLLINTPGSLDSRPASQTSIANLFLAADYVRVNIDLATMEGANEAGRQAANALLRRSRSNAAPAPLYTLWEPSQLDAAKREDEQRYRGGQPNALDTVPAQVPA
jgi:hypothetical protein